MPICKNPECKQKFVPNPRNRTNNRQVYCCNNCRYRDWDRRNPRSRESESQDTPDRRDTPKESSHAQG